MKLIYCPNCNDILRLTNKLRFCQCGSSSGVYEDHINALIDGFAIPLGISNESFIDALLDRPQSGRGSEFIAFVIPHECETVRVR